MTKKKKAECDKLTTESKCFKAISQIATNKSPDVVRVFIEYCKTFWQDFKNLFLNCRNYSFTTNQPCDSQYEGVITLISKPGKTERIF